MRADSPAYGMYLAVLPSYRRACIEQLRSELGDGLSLWISAAHLDPTVRSGLPMDWFSEVRMLRLGGRLFLQLGHMSSAVRCDALIVDLNPRSLTAWLLLIARRVLRRRTSVWGHLHSQSGASSRTALLRRMMRRLATNTIVYTYQSKNSAVSELPGQAVFVAANALYLERDIESDRNDNRNSVLYVGRFVPAKKVDLLIKGFASFANRHQEAHLDLVGGGSELSALQQLVKDLGLASRVTFHGWISDAEQLKRMYAQAFVSVSPGFVGLQITQSLGFGVPILIAKDEPHSPEVELALNGNSGWFESGDPQGLADALERAFEERLEVAREDLSCQIRTNYSAERMAAGLRAALDWKPV